MSDPPLSDIDFENKMAWVFELPLILLLRSMCCCNVNWLSVAYVLLRYSSSRLPDSLILPLSV